MEGLLADIRRRRDELQTSVAEHYRLLSSFRRLPDDMLREIFIWCLPSNRNAAMTTVEAPLLLGRVCSRWRTVGLQTPRLWASLHIPCPVPPNSTNAYPEQFHQWRAAWDAFERKLAAHSSAVDEWLTRSGTCPLAISFHPREAAPAQHDRFVKLYLDILLKFANRWFDVQITVPVGAHSSKLANLTPSNLPKLRHLDLKFACRLPHDKRWASSGLLNAPNLRSLQFVFLPLPVPSLQVDWSKLTRLSIQELNTPGPSRQKRISLTDAHHILSHCSKLRFCFLKIIDVNDAVSPTDQLILLDLHTLVLVEGAWGIASLLECLQVPALRRLSFHTSYAPSSNRAPVLTLLERWGSRLERFITDIFNFNLNDLLACFAYTPSLTHFANRISLPNLSRDQSRLRTYLPVGPFLTKSFINILTPGYLEVDYWPRLQCLDLGDVQNLPSDDVLAFIQGRMDTALCPSTSSQQCQFSPLRYVRIYFHSFMTHDIRPLVQKYCDSGLKVDLAYIPPRAVPPGIFSSRHGLLPRNNHPQILDDFAAY